MSDSLSFLFGVGLVMIIVGFVIYIFSTDEAETFGLLVMTFGGILLIASLLIARAIESNPQATLHDKAVEGDRQAQSRECDSMYTNRYTDCLIARYPGHPDIPPTLEAE